MRESRHVADLIKQLRDDGLPIVLISHDMPSVFELADRIHVQRLGRRAAVLTPAGHMMEDAVAVIDRRHGGSLAQRSRSRFRAAPPPRGSR